jgi:hypothetical protein
LNPKQNILQREKYERIYQGMKFLTSQERQALHLTSLSCTSPFVGTILVSASNGNWQTPFLGMLAFPPFSRCRFSFLLLCRKGFRGCRAGGWKWGIFTREVVLAI